MEDFNLIISGLEYRYNVTNTVDAIKRFINQLNISKDSTLSFKSTFISGVLYHSDKYENMLTFTVDNYHVFIFNGEVNERRTLKRYFDEDEEEWYYRYYDDELVFDIEDNSPQYPTDDNVQDHLCFPIYFSITVKDFANITFQRIDVETQHFNETDEINIKVDAIKVLSQLERKNKYDPLARIPSDVDKYHIFYEKWLGILKSKNNIVQSLLIIDKITNSLN